MKDANDHEIKIGDKIQRKDIFCYGRERGNDGKWRPIVNPPPSGSVVTDIIGCAVVTRHGVYVGRTLEVLPA